MKRSSRFISHVAGGTFALAVAVFLSLPSAVEAQKKSGMELMQRLQPIKTAADVAAIEPGDMVVMSCPKCKDTWVTMVEKPTKATQPAETKQVRKDACPGCGTAAVAGQGRQNQSKIVHVCRQCGSKNAFCCVLKKGSLPTRGMDQK